MTDGISASRRQFLHSAALVTSGMFLSGCVRRIPTWLPPVEPRDPLTVDVHCHFFNGTDLQMQRFLQYVVDANGDHPGDAIAAPLAQDINWLFAPTGKSEMRKLHSGNSETDARDKWKKAHAASYRKFRDQLMQHRAEAGLTEGGGAAAGSSLSGATKTDSRAWPKKYEDHEHYLRGRPDLAAGSLPAFEEYFQYRYVALADYLDLYNNSASKRTMDLMIAHLVDYDWPLNNGKPTRTPLSVQVKLMERISVMSHGRVHTFAPFDPFREIAYRAGIRGANWSALDAVQKWVALHGCIGVKIYPPMGFAPYGNCEIDSGHWCGVWDWLRDVEHVPDGKGGHGTIGQRLDDVLCELYTWCLDNDLPVMAHTALSNGLNKKFESFTKAKHWAALREQFGKLRVNFGHLGGFEKTSAADWNMISAPSPSSVNVRDLVALMSPDSAAPGGRFFGDSAYSEMVLSDPACLLGVYDAALSWTAPGQVRPVLPDRLMYGSDWSLLMLEEEMQKYFADFVSMYLQLDKSRPASGESQVSLSDRFFGANAIDYLGLRDGRGRQRLANFYATHGMTFDQGQQPVWMEKIKS